MDLLSFEERVHLLDVCNATECAFPRDQCIHELFEAQVERTPQAFALVFGDQALTYAQLNAQANQLAHYLVEQGVRPDDRVAICVVRGIAMVAGVLAILKAGGAYVPLDPAYPSTRLAQILHDAQPVLLLSDATGRHALGEDAFISVPGVDMEDARWITQSEVNPDARVLGLTSRHLAYIIYTSGSTGTPKGVMVEHVQVLNLFDDWLRRFPHLGAQGGWRAATWTSFGFDVSVFEFFIPLGSGGTLDIVPNEARAEAARFYDWLVARRITHAYLPPFFVRELASLPEQALARLALLYVLVGVEAIPEDGLHRLLVAKPGLRIANGYGPTEATVFCTVYSEIQPLTRNAPIGRPIANTRIYLLDAHGQPVPSGVTGEIYIGGAGVARGYFNRPELTAERFLADPFSPHAKARMYRTGDQARYLPDGNIQFLGRDDHQVKIRGFRIELGEIEARLMEHPAVREVVVMTREDQRGDKRLVAYVTLAADDATDTGELVASLRTHLGARLPEYMVPAAFVLLESLPLSPNGKLDRKALPTPDGEAYARQRYEAPQGEVEQILAKLWEELLGIECVSRHDNFFELGGHSLLAMRLLGRLPSAVGASLPLAWLFAHPTLRALALAILSARDPSDWSVLPGIVPLARKRAPPS